MAQLEGQLEAEQLSLLTTPPPLPDSRSAQETTSPVTVLVLVVWNPLDCWQRCTERPLGKGWAVGRPRPSGGLGAGRVGRCVEEHTEGRAGGGAVEGGGQERERWRTDSGGQERVSRPQGWMGSPEGRGVGPPSQWVGWIPVSKLEKGLGKCSILWTVKPPEARPKFLESI